MAEVNINLKCDLQHAVKVQYLDGNLFSQDAAANIINIEVTDGGAPATIGGTVSANVIRPDGGTVAVTGGTISGNIVSITLPAACYALVGMITIVVKLSSDSVVTTLAAAVANVYQSSTDTVVDPGTVVSSIQDLIDAIDTAVASIPADYSSLWTKLAPAFSSSTAYTAGQYVTYNGGLYRFTTAHAAGSWASGDVVAVNIGGELTDLKSAYNTEVSSTFKQNGFIDYDESMILNNSNQWTTTGSGSHVMIPVFPGDTIKITASSNPTIYAIFRSHSNPVNATTPDFSTATGFTTRTVLSANNATTITAPSDAAWLYLTKVFSGENFLPAVLTVNGNNMLVGTRKLISDTKGYILNKFNYQFEETVNIFTEANVENGYINNLGNLAPSEEIYSTDFLSCEAQKTYYISCIQGAPAYFSVIAFYNSNKEFISKLPNTETNHFTTPANCNYIRVSSVQGRNGFREKTAITPDAVYPYVPHLRLNNIDKTDENNIFVYLGMIDYLIDEVKNRMIINSSNNWDSYSTSYHILIPVNEGDIVEYISNKNQMSVYALLKSEKMVYGDAADINNVYTLVTYDDGSQEFVDTGVKDTRHVVSVNASGRIIIPPNTHFLYFTYSTASGENFHLPQYLKINDYIIINEQEEKNEYTTVLFDDFSSFNTDIWRTVTQRAPDVADNVKYNSRFVGNERTVKIIDGCLILSCVKDNGDNGVYVDKDGNTQRIEYISGYISSDTKLAIPKGRISAKIRGTSGVSPTSFPWCFWTFGQDNVWAKAHEMDIIETFVYYTKEDITSKSGVVIPAKSINNSCASTIHYMDTNNQNKAVKRSFEVNYAMNGPQGENTQFYLSSDNLDVTQWHVYAVQWDENNISFFIDDKLTYSIDASSLSLIESIFKYPQDIRFNIKAAESTSGNSASVYIDWVKVETIGTDPTVSISHEDVSISVGEEIYILPTFNNNNTNSAYTLETDDTCITIQRYDNSQSQMVINKIKGESAGTATVRITTPHGIAGTFTVTVS